MKTEIYINEQLVELYDDEPIVLSYSVNNLFEIESRQGSYSNTFRVPATKKNNRIFEFTNNVLSTSTLPYRRVPCQIFVDSTLVIEGTAQITATNPLEYEINVIGGVSTWYDSIKDISLREVLDNCEDSFKWNESEVISNRLNTWVDGRIYPNIDYGELFFLPPIAPFYANWDKFYPAVYVKYLFKKCLEFVGIQYASDFIDNDPLFQKSIIPFSAEFKRTKNYHLRNHFKAEFNSDFNTVPLNPFINWKFIFPIYETPCYDFLNNQTFINTDANDPVPFIYDAPGNSYYCILDFAKIKFEYNITVDLISIGAGAQQTLFFQYWDEDGNRNEIFLIDTNIQLYAGLYNIQGTIEIEAFRGAIYFGGQQGNGVSSYPLTIKAGSYFNIVEYTPFETDEEVYQIDTFYNWGTLAGTLPNITIGDFMLTLANQYGLIFEQKPQSNFLQIYQFKNVIENINNPVDWSKKLDLSERYDVSFISGEYSYNNYFKYAEDSEDEYLSRQPELGQGSFVFEMAPTYTEQTLFDSVFSATVRLNSFSGTVPLAWVPVYENGFSLLQPRICYIEFDDSAILTTTPSGYSPPSQPNVYFSELDFKNLLPEYYPLYSQILNNNKVVSVLLRLNNLDIAKLNFQRPVWIDYFGAYFYINEISQYNITENDSTRVELIIIQN